MRLYIGLMSGTSMDGVDAALVDIDNNKLIHGIIKPYENSTKEFLKEVIFSKKIPAYLLSQLNTILGKEFSAAVNLLLKEANIKAKDIIAIGSRGQTILHDAEADIPYTIQLACPHTIVANTKITVVADFRTRDLVLGGKGAPFAPLYHNVLFSHLNSPIAVINIGGIANVSFLSNHENYIGFDTGPGNCLMDAWTQKHLNLDYDANGEWASTGREIPELLNLMLNDNYFSLPYPKSIGKEYFSLQFLEKYLKENYAAKDVQTTLLAFTAQTISQALIKKKEDFKQVFICGGGAHNTCLLNKLRQLVPGISFQSTKEIGFNPDFIEAMMFAWLADKAINRIPLNFTAITGAKAESIYGAVYY